MRDGQVAYNGRNIISQAATPSVAVNGLAVGDIWVDTTSTPIQKMCTSISPVTFVTIPTITGGMSKAGGLILSNVTPSQPASTGSMVDVMTVTVPASTLVTNGDTLEINVAGITAANANIKSIGFYIGGSAISTSSAVAANNIGFGYRCTIVRTGSNTQTSFTSSFSASGSLGQANLVNNLSLTDTNNIVIAGRANCATATTDLTYYAMSVRYFPA